MTAAKTLRMFERSRRPGQRGWLLLEAAIATLLIGLLVVAVTTTARKATEDAESRRTASDTERAENALVGYAKSNSRLPAPRDAAPSPSRPGFIEGWLPVADLGMNDMSSNAIRYVVAQRLTVQPTIYNADPANLGAGNVKVRTTVNGLDLCASLMRRERAGDALPGGMRMGYALQQAISTENGKPLGIAQSWLGDAASGALPANARLDTRTRGFGEFAASLDCFARMAALSRAVRSVAVASDLKTLADQEFALRDVNLDMSHDSLRNSQWRMVNWSLGEAKFLADLQMEAVSTITSTTGIAAGVANMVSLTTVIGGTAWLLEYTGERIKASEKSVAAGTLARDAATNYQTQLQHEVDSYALQANALQNKGLDQ